MSLAVRQTCILPGLSVALPCPRLYRNFWGEEKSPRGVAEFKDAGTSR